MLVPSSLLAISVWCCRAKGASLPVCPRALHTHCDVYSSFCSLRIKSEVQRFPKLTLPFISALGSVEGVDLCRVWEQKQLMLTTAYPSFWDHSSIYMSETCVAYGGADLKAAPWAGAWRGTLNPALSWSPMGTGSGGAAPTHSHGLVMSRTDTKTQGLYLNVLVRRNSAPLSC